MAGNIQLHEVNKAFSNKVLFANLSYVFLQRTYHIIGNNGTGKSSLLRMLVGLDTPDSGSIILNHHYSAGDYSVNAKRLFYVPDDLAVYPFLTGIEFLSWLANARTNNAGDLDRILELFELQPHLNTRISSMSFGTKKKFLLCSALMGQPDFIILDEPLNGLDKKSQQTLLLLLQEKALHCGIILTTHHEAQLDLLNPVRVELTGQRLVDLSHLQPELSQ
ncbi:ABC transporter ATP-binding protein [Legionella sp. CNM-4043-24]|uniref:ABC transporter ATP-binding protein n=1 Tax=Legionella sp. CNM-4043-24 TaxID=3421646 RepID=UPI00403B00AE